MTSPPRRAAYVAAAALLGMFATLLPYVLKPWFYFIDDKQHYFLPHARDIGAMLHRGEFPWLSLNIWQAGNYVVEFQHGIFNPLNLALHYLLFPIVDQQLAAMLWAMPFVVLTAVGAFLLCARLGASPGFALVAALCASSSNYLLYWNAASWHLALSSFPWFILATWIALAPRRGAGRLVALAACVYLGFTSGYPQGMVALAVLGAVLFFVQAGVSRRWRDACVDAGAMISGALMAAPAFLPLAAALSQSARTSAVASRNILVPELGDLLNLSMPSFVTLLTFGYPMVPHISTVPEHYVAWFALPLLWLFPPTAAQLRRPDILVCLGAALVFLLASLGPDQLGPLRWPIRFVQFFQVLVLVVLVALLSQAAPWRASRGREVGAVAVLLLGFVLAWQQAPGQVSLHWLFLVVCLGLLGVWLVVVRFRPGLAASWLGLSTAVVFTLTHAYYEHNRFWQDWGASRRAVAASARDLNRGGDPVRYEFRAARMLLPVYPPEFAEHQSGSIPLLDGRQSINGYSPVGHGGLGRMFCMDDFGGTCPAALERLLDHDSATGVPLADLMRVDRVLLGMRDPRSRALSARLTGWNRASDGRFITVFERRLRELPGTVSYVPRGVQVRAAVRRGATRERIELMAAPDSPGGQLVFARLWWPGYRATLNGVPVPVEAFRGFLVSLRLPPGVAGTLELRYVPAGFHGGVALAAVGILLLLVASWGARVRPRQAPPVERTAAALQVRRPS